MRSRNIRCDKRNLNAKRLNGVVRFYMTCWKIHLAEIVCRKCKSGLTCFEFAVCARVMKKATLNAECARKEVE